jgi:Domain of unknown function (DUF5753)
MTRPGRWERYSDLVPDWFAAYLALEQQASTIRTYESEFVPGLLQTPDYARAVIGMVHADPDDVERRVELRLARQNLLDSAESPELCAVLDEATLAPPLLTTTQARAQLDKLIALTERSDVTIRIVTPNSQSTPADPSFSIVRLRNPTEPEIVYLEQLTDARYLDDPADVARFTGIMNRLNDPTVTPDRTRATLRRIRSDVGS